MGIFFAHKASRSGRYFLGQKKTIGFNHAASRGEPEDLGQLFDINFGTIANLSAFTQQGSSATWTLLGTSPNQVLSVSKTPDGIFDDHFLYDTYGHTMLEYCEQTMIIIPKDNPLASSGFGFGIKSTCVGGAVQSWRCIFRNDQTAASGKLQLYYDSTFKDQTAAIGWSIYDNLELKFIREKFVYTIKVRNLTTASAWQTLSWNCNFTGSNDSQRIGKHALSIIGGQFDVVSWDAYSTQQKNLDNMFIGHSIVHGNNALSGTELFRWADTAFYDQPNEINVLAAGNNQTLDLLNAMPEILSLNPLNVFITILQNDVDLSVPQATRRARYEEIVTNIESIGGTAYHVSEPPRDGDVILDNPWLSSTWPNEYIDINTPLTGTGTNIKPVFYFDGVHPNWLGHLYAGAIINKFLYDNSFYTQELSAEYTTYAARLNFTPTTLYRYLLNFVISKFVNASMYADFDLFYNWAGYNETQSLINIPNTNHTPTKQSAPTWAQYQGYTPDGIDDYIKLSDTLLSAFTKYGQNDGFAAVWTLNAGTKGADVGAFANLGTVKRLSIYSKYWNGSANKVLTEMNSSSGNEDAPLSAGFAYVRRTASGTYYVGYGGTSYSSSVTEFSVAIASAGVPECTPAAMARALAAGGANQFTDRGQCFVLIGKASTMDFSKMHRYLMALKELSQYT